MNSQNKPTKIAIVAYNLEPGGLANVIQNVFKLLESVTSFKVQLILLDQKIHIEKDNIILLSNKKLVKYFQLYKILNMQKWDYIIDFRFRLNPLTEILITKIIYPASKIIFTIHSSKLEVYLPRNVFLVNWLYRNCYKIVCVSKGIENLVIKKYDLNNTLTIYNPIDLELIIHKSYEKLIFDFEYILAVGRLEEVKQFDKLIEAYYNSILIDRNIKLVIVGDGSHLLKCKEKVMQLGIHENVIFEGFSNNPYKYMRNAKFLVLSSKYEGFGLVLAESLACGTPVISFDLQTGPNEIINTEENGLLVENQNLDLLTQEINRFLKNEELYKKCKSNSFTSIQKFSINTIREKWVNLIK